MVPSGALDKSFYYHAKYQALYEEYKRRGIVQALNPKDQETVFDQDWKLAHYFDAGADAVRNVVDALIANFREPPKAILDFPSGSGRVTRHFKSFFPDAHVTACDLYDHHIDFCAEVLGAEAVLSKENFDDLHFERKYDVIFCGSLLTHLPARLFVAAMRCMARALSDTGIAVVTTHGRHIEFSQKNKFAIIQPELFEVAQATIEAEGFGYVDYEHDLLATSWNRQENYGVTLTRPHWALKSLEDDYSIRILGYNERGWDAGQDVVIFGKPGVNAWMRNGDVVTTTPDPR